MRPESLVRRIHFEDFSGSEFERLCFAFVLRLGDWRALDWYGQLGGDSGRDIWGTRPDGDTVCFQCANHEKLKFEKARADIQKLASGPNGVPKSFVLISGHRVSAAMRDRVKNHAISMGITSAEVWTGEELEERLRWNAPDLLRRFTEGDAFPEDFERRVLEVFDRVRDPLEMALASRDWQEPRPPLAAVLWTKGLFFRHCEIDASWAGGRGMAVDLSSISFIVEELVANSAVKIIIPARSVMALAAERLPDGLGAFVQLVDHTDICGEAARAVLRPVAHELGLELHPDAIASRHGDSRFLGPLSVLSRSLADLILGCRYSAEIDVPITECLRALASLRRAVRQATSRTRLALLQGVLGAYREVRVSGVAYMPSEARTRSLTFDRLVRDALYEELARQRLVMGRPGCGGAVGRQTHRLADELAASSDGALREKRQRVQSAFPTLRRGGSMAREARKSGFLPPIVPLDKCRKAARAAWFRAEPEFIHPRDDFDVRAVEWSEERKLKRAGASWM